MRSKLMAAGLAALALAAGSPAYADRAEHVGTTCGLVAKENPARVAGGNPWQMTGVLYVAHAALDVLVAAPSSHTSDVVVQANCWIQINAPFPGSPTGEHVSDAGRGAVAVAGVVNYVASPDDNVYVCSRVAYTHPGSPTEDYTYDQDADPSNGTTCVLAMLLSDGENTVHVVEPAVWQHAR